MKTYRITTTEFYKNPSKALNLVKEGGVVYLAYKNLKDPIAVIKEYNITIEDEEKERKSSLKEKRLNALKKLRFKSKYWKSGLDLQNAVRQ